MTEHSKEVMERRRQGFEAHCKRMGYQALELDRDTIRAAYRMAVIAIAWDAWNAAMDSVVIELPGFRELRMGRPQEVTQYDSGVNHGIGLCTDAIESTGLGLRVTS